MCTYALNNERKRALKNKRIGMLRERKGEIERQRDRRKTDEERESEEGEQKEG